MIFLPSTNWISGDRWKRLLLTKLLIDLNDRFLVSDELACLYLVLTEDCKESPVPSNYDIFYEILLRTALVPWLVSFPEHWKEI